MRGWPIWIAGTFVLALVFHLVTIAVMPYAIMDVAMSRIAETGGVNGAVHTPRATAQARTVVRPSPDLIYTVCVFDVSEAPLRVTSPVPDTYWSLSFFAANSDNFFVLNDRQAGAGPVEIVLAAEGQAVPEGANPKGAPVVTAPSETGIVLFRTLIASDARFEALDALRREAVCAPL